MTDTKEILKKQFKEDKKEKYIVRINGSYVSKITSAGVKICQYVNHAKLFTKNDLPIIKRRFEEHAIEFIGLTKQELKKNLRIKKNGEIFQEDIEDLQRFKAISEGKNWYLYWCSATKLVNSRYNISLLKKFCNIEFGNYRRYAADDGPLEGKKYSDFFTIEKKELAKLQKRINYFID